MADNEQKSDDVTFENMSEIKPPRTALSKSDEEIPISEASGNLRQRMQMNPKMTDMQIIDNRLFPILKENAKWLNNLMVARVFPETFNPLRNILIKDLLSEYEDMSLAEATCLVEVALTIPLDGEGRLDIIHVGTTNNGNSEKEDKLAS